MQSFLEHCSEFGFTLVCGEQRSNVDLAEVLLGSPRRLHWEWTDAGQGRVRASRQDVVATTQGRNDGGLGGGSWEVVRRGWALDLMKRKTRFPMD